MPSTTLTCNKDARIALSGSTELGAGASDYLPVGTYGGYQYRSLLGFSGFSASWVSITSAVLHIRTSSQYYVAFGSDPDIEVLRLTSSWSEGSSVGLSGSNSVHWGNQPSATSTNQATKDVTTSENTWVTVTITSLMQDALAAGTFYGLRIQAASGSSTDVTEFYAREYGSYDAYIEVTYTTNVAPSAPTISAPTSAQIVTPTPTITATHVDSDGDALLKYDIQVSTDSTFASVTHLNLANQTAGITGNSISGTYGTTWAGTALSRGTTYYVRLRTYSSAGILTAGAWSAARSFIVNSLPFTALTEPGASGRTARLIYTPAAGWTTPRLVASWSYSDGNAAHATQSSYEIEVYNDSAGSPGSVFYDSGTVGGSASSINVPVDLVEGNYYHIRVRVHDSLEWSDWTAYSRVRARWGFGLYRYDMGSAPTTIGLDTLATTTSATSAAILEYSTNTTTATPATFYATVGEVPLQRYFFYRVYLFAWGSATPTGPSLDELTIDYSTTIFIPDNWTRSDTSGSVIVADPGSYVYGSRSLRITPDGAKYAYQSVPVLPNTNYILQGRVKSLGNSGAKFFLADTVNGTALVTSTAVTATQDFARQTLTVWNSGSRTSVIVHCYANGAAGTFGWFDALKLEASTVATPWSPGFVGTAIAIDAGGLQVDASAGGIMRLKGSSGGTRDLVELGANGLKFGGDLNIDSPEANVMRITGPGGVAVSYRNAGSAFPSSPDNGDVFFRSDHDMWFFYDGTRWLCTCLHYYYFGGEVTNQSASVTDIARGSVISGDFDVWVEKAGMGYHVTAGTALSGSHKWDILFRKLLAGGTQTTFYTKTINSGASATWRRDADVAVSALLGSTTLSLLNLQITKTGTPGNLYAYPFFTYRHVAT